MTTMATSVDKQPVFGGIEGGATQSRIVLIGQDGTVLSEATGPSSNHWLIGIEEAGKRLGELTIEAKKKAGMAETTPLQGLGMSLSGGDSVEASIRYETELKKQFPTLSENYSITCDTIGAIMTACKNGGMVLITGTGSNCQLLNPDESKYRCGGWGHMMGDEGSASGITKYCLKAVFDTEDNFDPSPHDISFCRNAMCKYFNVTDLMGMLDHLYTKFDKSFMAGLCKELSKGARDKKDPLCIEAFYEAGKKLGNHVLALSPKIDKSLIEATGGLHIVCTGSVWKSWDLLKEGFLAGLRPRNDKDVLLKEITLLELNKPASYGAAYLGAKSAHMELNMDFESQAKPFFHMKIDK